MNIKEFRDNKEFIIFILKWFNALHFEYSGKRLFTERLKTSGTAIKITRETTKNQQKKYNSVKRDDNFHSGIQVLKCL